MRDALAVFGVPFWAGAAHVMQFGTVGIVRDCEEPLALCHDPVQTAAKRGVRLCDEHGGGPSVRLAEHGGEGQGEDLVPHFVRDVHEPKRQAP